jgi:sugar O-acyltransferase (sialic acid O-acetyltransferase NeuD family)
MKIVIVGAGYHGSELYSYLIDLSRKVKSVKFAGFADDGNPPNDLMRTCGIGRIADLSVRLAADPKTQFGYITATGNNATRCEMVNAVRGLQIPNLLAWTLRHPHAIVGREVQIGEGTCICPGVILTTQIKIGRHCIVNVNSSISHDCCLGDYVNINPGVTVCGNVSIGEGCYIGTGATIKDKVSVGEWSVIGAGAVVISDIPPRVTAVGVPARAIKQHEGKA